MLKKFCTIILILFGLFFIVGFSLGASPITESFDSLTVGSIHTQSSWSSPGAGFKVITTQHQNGTQSGADSVGGATYATKAFTTSTDGEISAYLGFFSNGNVGNTNELLLLNSGDLDQFEIYIQCLVQDECYAKYKTYNPTTVETIGSVNLNTWYLVKLKWYISGGSFYFKYSFNEQDWSSGIFARHQDDQEVSKLLIGGTYGYVDNIGVYNPCPALTYAETCNCTSPLFPKPDYCGQCMWDYQNSVCQNISLDIELPAIESCQSYSASSECTAFSYCVWVSEEAGCDYYKNLPSDLTTTDPDFGILGNAIRDLFIWAFVPGEDVSVQWQILSNDISGKMPFGYFYLVKEKLTDISYSSSSFSTITVPFMASSAQLTIFDISSVSTYFGSTTWDLLQTLLSISLWVALLYYIFSRINDLKL